VIVRWGRRSWPNLRNYSSRDVFYQMTMKSEFLACGDQVSGHGRPGDLLGDHLAPVGGA
jgi:hypothetical protein